MVKYSRKSGKRSYTKFNNYNDKKVIYNYFKEEKIPSLIHIQNEHKNYLYMEKYFHYLKGKGQQFDKMWYRLNVF